MAALAEIQLQQRGASMSLVVNEVQRVDGLVDAADFCDGLREQVGRSSICKVRMMPIAGTVPSLRDPIRRRTSSVARQLLAG